jgi:hypothetical protein
MLSNFIPRGEAVAVADVLATVAELRLATANLARLRRRSPGNGRQWEIVAIEAEERAAAFVRDLTGRVQARAHSACMPADDLLRLAEAVIEGRRRLPAGVEAAEAA